MNIKLIIDFFLDFFQKCVDLLNSIKINAGGRIEIGLFTLFLTFVIFGLAISVLWKGVKK